MRTERRKSSKEFPPSSCFLSPSPDGSVSLVRWLRPSVRRHSGRPGFIHRNSCHAFTLIELLVVIAILGVLASMVVPSLSRARQAPKRILCVNNLRQLTLGWMLFANENEDRLLMNQGGDRTRQTPIRWSSTNWVNNIMTWELDAANTNRNFARISPLAAYVSDSPSLYRCPNDQALSDVQRQAGWRNRARSYSMNGMMGDAVESLVNGQNINNPGYLQFLTLSSIPRPTSLFVFLEEHPDSINDGYFLNRAESHEWMDLPAAYHNRMGNLAYADGHVETHLWRNADTLRPPEADAAGLPFAPKASEDEDFLWLAWRTSIERYTQKSP